MSEAAGGPKVNMGGGYVDDVGEMRADRAWAETLYPGTIRVYYFNHGQGLSRSQTVEVEEAGMKIGVSVQVLAKNDGKEEFSVTPPPGWTAVQDYRLVADGDEGFIDIVLSMF